MKQKQQKRKKKSNNKQFSSSQVQISKVIWFFLWCFAPFFSFIIKMDGWRIVAFTLKQTFIPSTYDSYDKSLTAEQEWKFMEVLWLEAIK